MTAASDVQAEIQQISDAIRAFRDHAKAGNAIDLSGLQDRVEGVCIEIAGLPAGSAPVLKNDLMALMDNMGGLVEELKKGQQAIGGQLGDMSSRHQAVSAYGKGAAASKADERSS